MTRSSTLPKNPSILLVDDDRHLLDSMGGWLETLDYRVSLADGRERAQQLLKESQFDLCLCDLRLEDGDGFDVLKQVRSQSPDTSVILMTGYATAETGVEALRAGAFDLLTKPLIDQELEMAIERALSQKQVIEENKNLKTQLDDRFGLESIVGTDHRMQKTFEIIESVADTRTTVLVTGESGTGKSLLARAIHQRSDRRDMPFIEVACGALPENLLESELFGHVAGSFTGATGNKEGKFKLAHGGTIFLDEIGTATPGLQVKLLRVLQELAFEPVGGSETVQVDVRVILATNDDLEIEVAEGRFRQDLYYRVNVINIELPSLRERFSDVPALAEHFLEQTCEQNGKARKEISSEAMTALQRYNWPGNVRELQNVIARAILLGKSSEIVLEDLPAQIGSSVAPFELPTNERQTLKQALEEPERRIILQVLRENGWNRNATAEMLDINRTTLYKKMKRLGLENPNYASQAGSSSTGSSST